MTTIAVAGYVHNITAQSDQISVSPSGVQRDGRYGISDLNRKLLILGTVVIIHETVLSIRSAVPKVERQYQNGHQNERSCNEMIFQPRSRQRTTVCERPPALYLRSLFWCGAKNSEAE